MRPLSPTSAVKLGAASVLLTLILAGCATGASRAQLRAAGFANADPPREASAAQPVPVDPSKDVVNLTAQRELTLGMVAEIHIAPRVLELTHIGMMQVRREPRGQGVKLTTPDPTGRAIPRADGDWIIVEAMGGGRQVSRTAVSDNGVDASETAGVVAIPDRTLMATFPTLRRVDTLVITSTATGQVTRVDVKRVMDEFCTANPTAAECRGT